MKTLSSEKYAPPGNKDTPLGSFQLEPWASSFWVGLLFVFVSWYNYFLWLFLDTMWINELFNFRYRLIGYFANQTWSEPQMRAVPLNVSDMVYKEGNIWKQRAGQKDHTLRRVTPPSQLKHRGIIHSNQKVRPAQNAEINPQNKLTLWEFLFGKKLNQMVGSKKLQTYPPYLTPSIYDPSAP